MPQLSPPAQPMVINARRAGAQHGADQTLGAAA